MNDLTKEELKILLRLAEDDFNDTEWYVYTKDYQNEIKIKLQSIINNHCEHEFYVNGCGENVFGQCFKCGEVKRLVRK